MRWTCWNTSCAFGPCCQCWCFILSRHEPCSRSLLGNHQLRLTGGSCTAVQVVVDSSVRALQLPMAAQARCGIPDQPV